MNERHGPDRRGTDRHTAGKTWRTWLEAAPLCLLWAVARRLPRRFAAHLAGALFATVGPLTRKQRHVKRNLSFVKPDASPAELERLARAVWRNLGAVLAEFPHLERIVDEAIAVEFAPETAALLEAGQPIVILTAHLGNWEVLGAWLARHGPPLTAIYDRHDNPIIERRIQTYRRADRIRFTDKEASLRELLAAAREGRSIGLLQDTRVDSGAMIPLFGIEAATTISPAKIGRRFGYPLVPVQVVREPGQRFRLRFHAPLTPPDTHDEKAAALALTLQYHRLLEGWIAARPGDWLCTKRRWPKTAARPA